MENEKPPRHGCLTAYLVFMLIANTLACVVYVLSGSRIIAALPATPPAIVYVFAIGSALNVGIVLCLFWWHKWAFYAFCLLAVVYFAVNLAVGIHPANAACGLIGPLVLYGVFQIGGVRKGWNNLK